MLVRKKRGGRFSLSEEGAPLNPSEGAPGESLLWRPLNALTPSRSSHKQNCVASTLYTCLRAYDHFYGLCLCLVPCNSLLLRFDSIPSPLTCPSSIPESTTSITPSIYRFWLRNFSEWFHRNKTPKRHQKSQSCLARNATG